MSSDVYSRKQPGPPPSTASCYICLEDGTDSEGQPLLRDCACRGEAGWAHVACLAKYAVSKITEARRKPDHSVDAAAVWKNCILCKTPYVQNMGLAMAEACVKHYEDRPDTNEGRWFSLDYLATINVKLGNHNAALKSFNRLLEIFKIVTRQGRDVRAAEFKVLGGLTLAYMKRDQFKDAITTIERQIEVGIDLKGPNSSSIRERKKMLTMLYRMIGERRVVDTAAELVSARQRFKEVEKDNIDTKTKFGYQLVVVHALSEDGQTEEAIKTLQNMISESRRALGPDHPVTLEYQNLAKDFRLKHEAEGAEIQKKNVWAVIDYEKKPAIHGQRVKVLKATKKDAGIYICQFKNRNDVSTKVKVVHDQFILDAGTAVVVHGLVSSKVLNGSTGIIHSFDKEKYRYVVNVGTKKAPVLIKPINLNIVFA